MTNDPQVFFEQRIAGRDPAPDDIRTLVELLWETYSRRVFLFACARLRNEEDAADICSTVFVRAMVWLVLHPGKEVEKVNFKSWLLRIASNAIVDLVRKRRPQLDWPTAPRDDQEDVMAEWADLAACDPQDALHRQEQLKALRDCLEILEEKKRTLLVLHDLEGVKFDELTARFSMTSTAVGVTLYRTRMALRDCVEERLAS